MKRESDTKKVLPFQDEVRITQEGFVSEAVIEIMREKNLKVIAYCGDCRRIISSHTTLDSYTIKAVGDAGKIHAWHRRHSVEFAHMGIPVIGTC